MVLKIRVHHWRYEDGEPDAVDISNPLMLKIYPTGFRDPIPKGWYCWCYPNDDNEFMLWMTTNCPKTELTHRFNSGDPMWQTHISDEPEATLFMLRWL